MHPVPSRSRPSEPVPVLATGCAELAADVLDRLPRPVAVDVGRSVAEVRRAWPTAPRVLVASDLLPALAGSSPALRAGVALVLPDGEDPPDGMSCVRLGVEQVLDLGASAAWLAADEPALDDLPTDRWSTDPPPGSADAGAEAGADAGAGGRLVAVTGARGGCGTSTLAAALALSAAAEGHRVLLVDLDDAGGGLDVLLGGEDLPGLRWPDLRTDAARFDDLPAPGGVRLLSAGRVPTGLDPGRVGELLRRTSGSVALTVVDLPRTTDPAVLPAGHRLLLVVPDEVRAATAAAVRLTGIPPDTDVRIVVRDGPTGEKAERVAARLGRPLAGRLRSEPRLVERAERGLARPARRASPLWRLADHLLAELVPGPLDDLRSSPRRVRP